jgi:dipeptidyl aminopeptidase/acylaminoacyl peptidase
MNRHDALGRELTAWFDETAAPRRPDYTTDIIQITAALPQRRWLTLERLLPMTVIQMRRVSAPFPWKTAAVLIALLALLLAGAIYVGSQPRLPPPFGIAGNGLVAYAKDGDIFTVDPTSGVRRWVTSGPDLDHLPRWSRDGTRLAFLRQAPGAAAAAAGGPPAQRVVIVDRERNILAESIPIYEVDPDAFAWSPDGRYVAAGGDGVLSVIDTADGGLQTLNVGYEALDFYWRPRHLSELLFRGQTAEGTGLVLVDVERPRSARLVAADEDMILRPSGWTVDGQRIVYTVREPGVDGAAPAVTRILDLTTQAVVDFDAAYADVSNDGTQLLAIDHEGRPCIASIDGGSCIAIAGEKDAFDGTYAGGTFWAPDDQAIVVTSASGERTLLDPAGSGTFVRPSWMAEGAESWQRVAR